MQRGFWLSCLVSLFLPLTAAAQQLGTYTYSPTFGLGMSVPLGWMKLDKAPHGYPTQNFLFGWRRSIGKDVAVIIVSRLPVSIEGPAGTPIQVNLEFITNTFTDYFNELGASIQVQKVTLGGKEAIAVFARGVGNGIAINPRIGTRLTRVVWCGLPLSSSLILRVQFGAPDELFDHILPDFIVALQTFHFGPPNPPAQPLASQISEEKLKALVVEKAKVQETAPPVLPSPTVTVSKEQTLLAPEQWTALEAIAREKGISVGALLRQIVDEFLKRYYESVKERPKE